MNPTSNTPSNAPGNAPAQPHLDAPLAGTEPTSGPAGSTYDEYKQKANDGIQAILDSGKQGLAEGKKLLEDSDLSTKAKELPQQAKALGNQALAKFNELTTTQKIVGVSLLTAGIAFLATRGNKDKGEYRPKARRSPFAKNSDNDYGQNSRGQQRPWGSSRYGSSPAPASAGKSRVMAGSGTKSAPQQPSHQRDQGQRPTPPSGQRRDQGPASGSRYDASTSGGQNPNNLG